MYQELVKLILSLVGHDYLYFPTAIEGGVGSLAPYSIWAVCVSPDNEIYAMSSSQEWFKVEEEEIVVPEIYTKVRLIHSLYTQNSNQQS